MRTKQLMLYSFILVLLFVLVGCAAPAAAPADAPGDGDTAAADAPAAGDEQIELRVAWWGSQNRHDRTIKAIELFEEAYPNIDVIYEFSGWDDHWTKMATQAAGGNLPDVMQQDYARLEEWVDRGLMMPLDDYVDDGTLNFADVSEGELAGGRVDGVLYAVNLGTNSQAVLIDLDAFAEAGIDVPAQDWSWEDLEQISTELHDTLDIWGMGPSLNGEQFWKSLYLGHGEWSYNNEGTALGYEDDQIFIDYLHMLLRMQDAG
ncbi:MAG: extracellular solute-binding protein, partial [Caldilineaceae bacterium]|nr:extracellular solute-binding protein [Caldilineaceae bacterium]